MRWQESSHSPPPCALLLHPPARDVALKHYCSEPLKINAQSGGMKGKQSPSVPRHSLLNCPDLGQGNFLLPAPHLEACAEGCLLQDLSEVPLLIILEMSRTHVREHAFRRRGRASPILHAEGSGAGSGHGLAPTVFRWGEGLLCASAEQPSGTRVPRAAGRQSR